MTVVAITGVAGQLGRALSVGAPSAVELVAADRSMLDITDIASVQSFFKQYKPDGLINAAAYTAVDKAETEAVAAAKVNADGPQYLAEAALSHGTHLVHVSTDFVFDGYKNTPYQPDDKTNPLSVYGQTKLAGEQAVLGLSGLSATVVRTAWVYDNEGSNFLTTMLRLMNDRDSMGVVCDQLGSPTHVGGLAKACWRCLDDKAQGIRHWTDAGVASWYDFAVAIQDEAVRLGLVKAIPISPITTNEYPTPAKRPSYSVLANAGPAAIELPRQHWRRALVSVMSSLG